MTTAETSPAPAGLRNTALRYGGVAKTFHWLTALLILTLIPLGLVAERLPYATSDELALKATVFSIHKTLGVAVFFVALARILWALLQPKPALLNGHRPAEAFAAETVHWILYASLVLVPLSGWIHHAATTGFAPIWWPFGQSLPFVPQSEPVAHLFAGMHWVFTKVLGLALLLHVAGALKHHVIDRDQTLRRMLPGTCPLPEHLAPEHGSRRAPLAAAAIWALAVAGGAFLGLAADREAPAAVALQEVQSDWAVSEGSLSITVQQLGAAVTGSFADWTAQIAFSETPDAEGRHGEVTVIVSIPSLSLGGVTQQALEAEFLNAAGFPTATFTGPILAEGAGYVIDGTLTLTGETVPLRLPFTLAIDGDTATATGAARLDRRDFGIGPSYPDENTVGFSVDLAIAVTASRAAP